MRHKDCDALEDRLKRIETRALEARKLYNKKVQALKDGMTRLTKLIQNEKTELKESFDIRVKSVESLESKLAQMTDSFQAVKTLFLLNYS